MKNVEQNNIIEEEIALDILGWYILVWVLVAK